MTVPFVPFGARSNDIQDGFERHIYGELEYHDAGAIIKVKGTDTEDEEATVLVMGAGSFKLKKGHDAEVFLLASSSDTQLKMAVLQIPHDKQRRWPEGEGGVQHPTDDEFALHFSDKMAHITKNKFGVGKDGEFEIKEAEGYFRTKTVKMKGDLHVEGTVYASNYTNGPQKPPGFEGNKQEEKKSSGSGGGTPAQLALDLGDAD
jgi:hypothetical protein